MKFRRALLGYSQPEVDAYIGQIQNTLSSKDAMIGHLNQKIRQLEYDVDGLEVRISIYEELRRGHTRPGKNEESSNYTKD